MIVWINGAYGAGKTSCAYELQKRIPKAIVYDPENTGFFIRKNIPKELHKPDFQDHELWRLFNYEMLRYLAGSTDDIILVPMTLLCRRYYDEIIGRLTADGICVRHFILCAERQTLKKRLHKRLEGKHSWAWSKIEHCLYAFEQEITEEKITTDGKNISSVAEEIAKRCGITLPNDKRSAIEKVLDRIVITMRHIR